MTRSLASVALFLFALVPAARASVAPPSVSARLAQDDEREDERDDVAERIKTLQGHIKKKGDEDLEAIAVVDGLTNEFGDFGPKDRADVVKAIDACFKARRPKELEPGVVDDRLVFAAATALGEMGPESVKSLLSRLGDKSVKNNMRVKPRVALSMGRTRDERVIDPLTKLLVDKDMEMQAAAAEALGNFADVELDARKDIFKELLSVLIDLKTKRDGDATDQEAFKRWNMISGPFVETMQRLSKHDEREAEAWQAWWNDNKKKDWDAEDE